MKNIFFASYSGKTCAMHKNLYFNNWTPGGFFIRIE
jgi:hypothetical protein